jgi:hypothetical protein
MLGDTNTEDCEATFSHKGRGEKERPMKPLLGDLPFKNSRRVYLAIKLAVLALGVLLALHFLWGVV